MAGEGADAGDGAQPEPVTGAGDAVTVQVPESLGEWLEQQVADEPGRDRADVLRDLAAAYREVSDDAHDAPATRADLRDRLESQRAEYVELVEDVRERVVDLRRELDALADAEHTHDASEIEGLDGRPDDLESRLGDLEDRLDDLETRVDEGFGNYETVLEELTDAVDELGDRVNAVASTVVDRDEETARGGQEPDGDLAALRRAANEAGVREATCGDCGGAVDVALLTDADCPHCATPFTDVSDDGGLFGSPTLVTTDPPALQAGGDGGDPA